MFDFLQLLLLALLGLAIGFVGGLVGLVLGVIRFPLILSTELSASLAVLGIAMLSGTFLEISTASFVIVVTASSALLVSKLWWKLAGKIKAARNT